MSQMSLSLSRSVEWLCQRNLDFQNFTKTSFCSNCQIFSKKFLALKTGADMQNFNTHTTKKDFGTGSQKNLRGLVLSGYPPIETVKFI